MNYTILESDKYEGCYNIYDENDMRVMYFAKNDKKNKQRAENWVKKHSPPPAQTEANVSTPSGWIIDFDKLEHIYRPDPQRGEHAIKTFVERNAVLNLITRLLSLAHQEGVEAGIKKERKRIVDNIPLVTEYKNPTDRQRWQTNGERFMQQLVLALLEKKL